MAGTTSHPADFHPMNRTDLADPTAGILATLDQHHPVAVFERGGGEGEASFELEAAPNGSRLDLIGGDIVGHWSLQAQVLRGRLRGADGSTTPIEAIGASCNGELTGDSPAAGEAVHKVSLHRSIVICLEDGGLLAIFTARGTAATEHGEEERTAALASATGEVTEFAEVRLSTEYGPDGTQRRATLELWPADGSPHGPLRGAGASVASTDIELAGARSTLAFFEWSVGGSLAVGRYEIIRPH